MGQLLSTPTVNTTRPPDPPATVETPPCKIDHTAYPRIMDLIIDSAPYASLMVLRATCKQYRDRVARVVPRHVAVTDEASVLRAASGRAITPTISSQNQDTPFLLVVDYIGRSLSSMSFTEPSLLSTASVARSWYANGYPELSRQPCTRTWVMFCWRHTGDSPFDKAEIFRHLHAHLARHSVATLVSSQIPPSDTLVFPWPQSQFKLVINIDCQPWNTQYLEHSPPPTAWWSQLSTLVVVFHHRKGGYPALKDRYLGNYLRKLLERIHPSARYCASRLKVSFVNWHIIAPRTFTDDSLLLYMLSLAKISSPPSCKSLQECIAFVSSHVKRGPEIAFLSLEEYEEMVGRVQFKLETDDSYMLH